MILPGETEAGTAGTQPCRGISRGLIETMNGGVRARSCAAQPPSDRKTPCLENPRPKGGIFTNGERRFSRLNQDKTTRHLLANRLQTKRSRHESNVLHALPWRSEQLSCGGKPLSTHPNRSRIRTVGADIAFSWSHSRLRRTSTSHYDDADATNERRP